MKVYSEISKMAELLPKRSGDYFIDFLSKNMSEGHIRRAIVYWNRIATIAREDKHSFGVCGSRRNRSTRKRRGKTEHPYNNAKKVINLLYKVKGAKGFECEYEGFKPSASNIEVLGVFKKNSRDIQALNKTAPKHRRNVSVSKYK